MPIEERDNDLIERAFSAPLDIPDKWKSWLISYIESHPPVLPFRQIFGANDFAPTGNEVGAEDTISSTTYVAGGTAGPTLSALPKGSYVVIFGASAQCNGGQILYMGVSANGATPTDAKAIEVSSASNNSYARGMLVDLAESANTLECKYRVGGSTGTARYRWMIAIKYADL